MKRKQRDWTIPGHKYTGPGNSIVKGKPNNHNDAVSRDHDLEYNILGRKAYKQWSSADQTALDRWQWNEYGGAGGKIVFGAKKLLYQAGIIGKVGDTPQPGKKRLRGGIDPVNPSDKKIQRTSRSFRNSRSFTDGPNEPPSMSGASRTGDGDGSGNDYGMKETPVDDPRQYQVHRGPPDEAYVSLPYSNLKYVSANTYAIDQVYRMTSPYDPDVTVVSSTVPGAPTTNTYVAVPDASDTDSRSARWFRFYAGIYKYYHVTSCQYKIWIQNLTGEPLFCHLMFYNDELPPSGASNEDMMTWRGVHTKILSPQYVAIETSGEIEQGESGATGNIVDVQEDGLTSLNRQNFESSNNVTSRGGKTQTGFSGYYAAGDFKREIILDSQVENWTAVTANPILSERLLLRLKPENPAINATTARGDAIECKIRVELNYLVEFKELQAGLRWPVSRQPLQVAIDQNIFSTTS